MQVACLVAQGFHLLVTFVLEPQNLYLGELGGHFGTLGVILMTRVSPLGSTGEPLEPEVVFRRFFVLFLVSLGDNVGVILVTVSSFVPSKIISCGPVFLMVLVWKSITGAQRPDVVKTS